MLACVVGIVLAGCSGDESPTAATATAETGAGAGTAAGAGEAATPVSGPESPQSGSCADELEAGSTAAIACSWIAEADEAVCERMSDRLLEELFGAPGAEGREGCRARLRQLSPTEDGTAITFETPEGDSSGGRLVVTDDSGPRTFRYEVVFVGADDGWLIDDVQQVEVEQAGSSQQAAPVEGAADERAIKEPVLRWYRDLDPDVCDLMTESMLEFGWGGSGEEARRLCREAIAEAEPLVNVRTRKPFVRGDTATVVVVYTLDGERQWDRVGLVRREGVWLIDAVKASGFA